MKSYSYYDVIYARAKKTVGKPKPQNLFLRREDARLMFLLSHGWLCNNFMLVMALGPKRALFQILATFLEKNTSDVHIHTYSYTYAVFCGI